MGVVAEHRHEASIPLEDVLVERRINERGHVAAALGGLVEVAEGQLPGLPVHVHARGILVVDRIGQRAFRLGVLRQRLGIVALLGEVSPAAGVELGPDLRSQHFHQRLGPTIGNDRIHVHLRVTGEEEEAARGRILVRRAGIRHQSNHQVALGVSDGREEPSMRLGLGSVERIDCGHEFAGHLDVHHPLAGLVPVVLDESDEHLVTRRRLPLEPARHRPAGNVHPVREHRMHIRGMGHRSHRPDTLEPAGFGFGGGGERGEEHERRQANTDDSWSCAEHMILRASGFRGKPAIPRIQPAQHTIFSAASGTARTVPLRHRRGGGSRSGGRRSSKGWRSRYCRHARRTRAVSAVGGPEIEQEAIVVRLEERVGGGQLALRDAADVVADLVAARTGGRSDGRQETGRVAAEEASHLSDEVDARVGHGALPTGVDGPTARRLGS